MYLIKLNSLLCVLLLTLAIFGPPPQTTLTQTPHLIENVINVEAFRLAES